MKIGLYRCYQFTDVIIVLATSRSKERLCVSKSKGSQGIIPILLLLALHAVADLKKQYSIIGSLIKYVGEGGNAGKLNPPKLSHKLKGKVEVAS